MRSCLHFFVCLFIISLVSACSKNSTNTNKNDNSDFDSLIVEIDIPHLSSQTAIIKRKLKYKGLGIEKIFNGEDSILRIADWDLFVEFEPNYSDFEEYGILVKAKLIDNQSDGSDPLYGLGFLNDKELIIYYATVLYGDNPENLDHMRAMNPLIYDDGGPTRGLIFFPSSLNKIMLRADNINNMNNFEAVFYEISNANLPEYNDDTDVVPTFLEFTSEPIYKSILEKTPISFYESTNGERINLQIIKSPKVDQFGTKAIVLGKIYDENSEEDFICTPITPDNMFSISGFYGMEMGKAIWDGDILRPKNNGKVIEMPLKERRLYNNENEINY